MNSKEDLPKWKFAFNSVPAEKSYFIKPNDVSYVLRGNEGEEAVWCLNLKEAWEKLPKEGDPKMNIHDYV